MDNTTALRIAGSAFAVLVVGGTTAAAIPQAMRGTSTSTLTIPAGTTTLVLAQDVTNDVTGVEGTAGVLTAHKAWSFSEPEIRFDGPDAQGVTSVRWNCALLPGTPSCGMWASYTLPRKMNIRVFGTAQASRRTEIRGMQGQIEARGVGNLGISDSQPTKLNLVNVNTLYSQRLTQPSGAIWNLNGTSMRLELTDLSAYALKSPTPYSAERTFARVGTPGTITVRGVNYQDVTLTHTGDKYQCQFNGDGVRTVCVQLPAVLPNPWDGLPLNLPRVSAAPAK